LDKNRKASNQQIEDYMENIETKGVNKHLVKLIFKYFLRNGRIH